MFVISVLEIYNALNFEILVNIITYSSTANREFDLISIQYAPKKEKDIAEMSVNYEDTISIKKISISAKLAKIPGNVYVFDEDIY